jgi:hypothetical protein
LEPSTKENQLTFEIPAEFISLNLFIEVSTLSKKSFDTYFSTSLICNISETMGEVKVLDSHLKPLPKIYIKCFAKFNDESVKFYKDGYTDLRGRFNFVSLNTDQIKNVKKFALFIMSDEWGSIIKETNPPSNISTFVTEEPGKVMSEYDKIQNYRQEVKNVWKTSKMK